MQTTTQYVPRRVAYYPFIGRWIVTATLALAASFGFLLHSSAAAEIDLSGTGTFKPPSTEQVASLPPDIAFSRTDIASGTWSFLLRYEDGTADADPDPYVGRYVGAIRMFQLTVGNTTVDLAADQAELVVSDGGLGIAHRESIRLEASSPTPHGVIRASWVQLNQPRNRTDLRGVPGSLPSDSLPEPSMMVNLATSSVLDRFLLLRIDAAGGGSQPLLYLNSSKVLVLASPAGSR